MAIYRTCSTVISCMFVCISIHSIASAEDPVRSTAKAVIDLQAIPLPESKTTFQLDGRELTTLHYSESNNRIFFYPIKTSRGLSLTRMGHPHDPWGHSHHNSVWFSHADVDGVDFWGDRPKNPGRIVLDYIPGDAYEESSQYAALKMVVHWRSDGGRRLHLVETRRVEIRPLDGDRSWLLLIESQFSAPKEVKTRLGPTPFGLAAVRMTKSIGVHDGGGRIMNSEGQINEKQIFRKPARWCDYTGRLDNSPEGFAGIALMNHPSNPVHPAPFHVRDDGWMGACLNFEKEIIVEEDSPLFVQYGYWIHDGIVNREAIEARWAEFSQRRHPLRK